MSLIIHTISLSCLLLFETYLKFDLGFDVYYYSIFYYNSISTTSENITTEIDDGNRLDA